MKPLPILVLLVLCSPLGARAETYIYDHRLDESVHDLAGPFNYFLNPSDALGFMDAQKAFQLTGDGAYNAYWGELTLWAGTPLKRLDSRVRTLDQGCIPVFNYGARLDDIEYTVKSFATPVGLDPHGNLLGFVRLTATNKGKESRRAAVGARVFTHEGPWRHPLFNRSKPFWWADQFIDRKKWTDWEIWEETHVKNGGEVYRSECDHLVFTYRANSPEWQVIEAPGNCEPFEFVTRLAPGKSASIDLTMPYVPVAANRAKHVREVADAGFDDYLRRTTSFWEKQLNAGAVFSVPEEKVMNMHRASLMYDLMARDLEEDRKTFIQTVSDVQYDAFFSRDGAYIIHTYDQLGLHEIAEQTIEYVLLKDEDGKLTGLRATHPDAWGQALWTLGAHYRITGDKKFAQRVYPAVAPHIAKLETEIAKDPWGLWPVAGPYDNERIDGHYTGHSFWVLRGLKDAVDLATAVGHPQDAKKYQAMHDEYLARFLVRLKNITDQTGGYIPPGLDRPLEGMDWANASGGVYPFGVLSADNPLVKNTVQTIRDYAFQEGIMTYEKNAFKVKKLMQEQGEDWSQPQHTVIHHYETFYVLQTMLGLGMDREVISDFYSYLVHTGSTQTAFEYDVWAWRDREFHNNYPPHGWSAARFNEFFRNMLVREDMEKPVLHLASALSPAWLAAGKQVRVVNAPSDFGRVSFTIDSRADGASISLASRWRQPPAEILFHLPWFIELQAAELDGQAVSATDGAIKLPADAKRLELKWTWKTTPDLSYQKGVGLYTDKYWKIQRGEKIPDFDCRWIFPE
jgi:hypothetical protein